MAEKHSRQETVYVISVAAELAGMHPQTLRIYERRGLVNPGRTSGGNRRYTDADIARLRRIAQLAAEGLNLEGIRMVMRQFETALGRVGIERVRAVGLAFDPSQHEAVQHVDSEQYPANVVASEFQAGYRIGDYLLRAAMVAVSRGPGPAKPAEGASTTDSSDGAGEA